MAFKALILGVVCSTSLLLPAEDAKQATAAFLEQIREQKQVDVAFYKLCDAMRKPKGKWEPFVETCEVQSLEAIVQRQSSGNDLAFVKISRRVLTCGNGRYFGGMTSPEAVTNAITYHNDVLTIDAQLQTRYLVLSGGFAFFNAVGAQSDKQLIQLAANQSPHLIIYDLSKPDFPTMLNLAFNPHMTAEPMMVRMDDESPEAPHATRFCRWSFVLNSLTNAQDILIEEKKNDAYVEVARFVFDAKERKWKGPAGSDDDVWKSGPAERNHAKFQEADIQTLPRYKKYDPQKLNPNDE